MRIDARVFQSFRLGSDAEVPYSHADHADPGATTKFRPVVVTQVHPGYLVVRPIYSNNAEGQGQRLNEPERAGLNAGAVVAGGDVVVSLDKVGALKGRLTAPDRRLGQVATPGH